MRKLASLTFQAAGLFLVLAAFSAPANAFSPTPEIDPGSMAGALTLLGSGVLLITARRRAK